MSDLEVWKAYLQSAPYSLFQRSGMSNVEVYSPSSISVSTLVMYLLLEEQYNTQIFL